LEIDLGAGVEAELKRLISHLTHLVLTSGVSSLRSLLLSPLGGEGPGERRLRFENGTVITLRALVKGPQVKAPSKTPSLRLVRRQRWCRQSSPCHL
jgi:hypothetical protein